MTSEDGKNRLLSTVIDVVSRNDQYELNKEALIVYISSPSEDWYLGIEMRSNMKREKRKRDEPEVP